MSGFTHPLYMLFRDAGEIEQVSRGFYRLSSAPPLSSPDLVPIAIRVPRAVVCLTSAQAHHGLTIQVRHTVDVALPSHAQVPKVDGPPSVFWYPDPSFSAGVEVLAGDDVSVRMHSPESQIKLSAFYFNGRAPKIRISTNLRALCCQSGPAETLATPTIARRRSIGSRSLRMSPLLIARFTSARSAAWIWA